MLSDILKEEKLAVKKYVVSYVVVVEEKI